MNEFFNRDGPVEVSQSDFDSYQALFGNGQADFDHLVNVWLDERHPDGIRRLCLRDVLRQDSFHPVPHAHYYTGMPVGRFCVTLTSSHQSKPIPLEQRPKLLDELLGELLFALNNNRCAKEANSSGDINKLIKYLVQRTDEETGRHFIPYHSLWGASTCQPENTTSLLYDIIDPKLPAWLRTDL